MSRFLKILMCVSMALALVVSGCGGGGGGGSSDDTIIGPDPEPSEPLEELNVVESAGDGGFYLLGQVNNAGSSLIFVEKLDFDTITLARAEIPKLGTSDPAGLVEFSTDQVAVVGASEEGPNSGAGDLLIATIDFSDLANPVINDVILEKQGDDLAATIRAIDGGGFLVTGTTGDNKIRVIRLEESLQVTWDVTVNRDDVLGADALIDGGQLIVLGNAAESSPSNNFDIYLAEIDLASLSPTGGLVAPLSPDTIISAAGDDLALALEKTSGGYLVVGSTNSFSGSGSYDILAIRTEEYGAGNSLQSFLINNDDFPYHFAFDDFPLYARKLVPTEDGFLIAGATEATLTDFDAALFVLNAAGVPTHFGSFDGNLDSGEESDDWAFMARKLSANTYQLAGLSGTDFDFSDPLQFSISGEKFFVLDTIVENGQDLLLQQ